VSSCCCCCCYHFMALWTLSGTNLGQPRWAATRRNIHPLTPIVGINHPLSAFSIFCLVYSSCTPSVPLSVFLFFQFPCFFFFSYCFSKFLIPPPCFLMTAWTFWQSTSDLCCFLHYIFHLLPVFISSRYFHSASATLFLTMLWYSLHAFSLLNFDTHTLGSNCLHHLFVVLNRMSITNNLCFGTHPSLGMTLTLRIFALSYCHTII